MDNARLTFLFYKDVNRNCSHSERQELLRLLADPANDEQTRILLTELWDQVPPRKLTDYQSDSIFNTIMAAQRAQPFFWLKMAAVFVLMVLSVLAGLYLRGDYSNAHIAHVLNSGSNVEFLTLSDGSTVILKAGSTLRYPESFAADKREVFLQGEAFFDVTHDSSRLFVVHTGELHTTVLGTAFNIKAYPKQESITVTVKKGRVKVSDDRRVLGIVNPNEQISLNQGHRNIEHKPVDSRRATSWIQKDISFEDITMGEAIGQLAKRFDVSISLADDNIGACRFTATFVQGEDVRYILEILCEFNNATLQNDESGGFLISGGACGPRSGFNTR